VTRGDALGPTRGGAESTGLLSAIAPRRWAPTVFGVVSEAQIRRRPGDIARILIAIFIVVVTALATNRVTEREQKLYELLVGLPAWLHSMFEWVFDAGTIGVLVVVALALVLTRRWGPVLRVVIASAAAWLIAVALRNMVDSSADWHAARLDAHGSVPVYPVVQLAVAVAGLLAIAPFLVRPARRLVLAALVVAATCAVAAGSGLPLDVVGSFALGWGVAAALHLAFGTPAATPTLGQVERALADLGVAVSDLRLNDAQVWGETRFTGVDPAGGPVSVDVIGRDSADARLVSKVVRSLIYRDSGPSLALTRPQQLEHRAYVLLLAAKSGVPVSEVVIAGMAGAADDAVLVLRTPAGTPLTKVDATRVTDAVLDDVWRNLHRLHASRLAHGQCMAGNVLLLDDGTTAFVDFANGSSAAPPERCARDRVELIATTAVIVGDERALSAALRALGRDGLADILPLLESAALSSGGRRSLADRKKFFTGLREQGAQLTDEEVPKVTELRRVSPGDIVMAAATFLGFYLIIIQFVGIDIWATLQTAEVAWVVVAALLSPLPQFTGGIALQGSVATPLPYGPVVAEQFANNFTGLIGGTVATTALVIQFFRKQGLKVAVAASSGIMNSLAGGIVQVALVVLALIVTHDNWHVSSTGDDSGVGQFILIFVIVVGVVLGVALLVPKLRHAAKGMVQPQIHAARENLHGILTTPRKAVMLFGGNLASQLIFALVLDASLHAYGATLPFLQLVLINSLASVLGGLAPVPGGMGVIEAGLIAGLTAAGIPNEIAVATTFTHRLFTAYLPPIWGWFALRWLRRNDYV